MSWENEGPQKREDGNSLRLVPLVTGLMFFFSFSQGVFLRFNVHFETVVQHDA